jgi:protein-tyrosine phosphatase
VCTANEYRSPIAAALLAKCLERKGVPAAVRSVGVDASGRAARPEVVTVMREHGIDLSGHVSRPLEARLVTEADLVLGMAREHVREAVVLVPDAWDSAFTLKELVRRADDRPRGQEPLRRWLHDLGSGRDVGDLLGSSPKDDVEDLVGRPLAVVREAAAALDALVSRLVRLAWPRAC